MSVESMIQDLKDWVAALEDDLATAQAHIAAIQHPDDAVLPLDHPDALTPSQRALRVAIRERDAATADVARLRKRTHELQEKHDREFADFRRTTHEEIQEFRVMKNMEEDARECLNQETENRYHHLRAGVSDHVALALGRLMEEGRQLQERIAAATAREATLKAAILNQRTNDIKAYGSGVKCKLCAAFDVHGNVEHIRHEPTCLYASLDAATEAQSDG